MSIVFTLLEIIWEANISLLSLVSIYVLFLRRLTYFQWNRLFLLLTPVLSMLIAAINIEVEELIYVSPTQIGLSLSDIFPALSPRTDEAFTAGQSGPASIYSAWPIALVMLLGLGCVFFLVQMLIQWWRLRLELAAHSIHLKEHDVYRSNRFQTAFAFLNRVYIPDSFVDLPTNELRSVIAHERAHIALKHGRDNALITLIKPFFWYNPVYWFLHQELRTVHEFQVDERCTAHSQNTDYTRLLLKLSAPGLNTNFIHPFSKTLIKKRVTKLNQLKSSTMKKVLFLLAIPVAGMLFYAFSLQRVQRMVVTETVVTDADPERQFIMPIAAQHVTGYTPFGPRKNPLNEQRKNHTGIDLVAPMGAEIYAAAYGTVRDCEESETGYGNNVEIVHKDGFTTRYAHLQRFVVSAGQSVRQGEVIGYCGSTGKSTGPHLHFEVLQDGEAVDPEQYISVEGLSSHAGTQPVNRDRLVIIIDAGHGGEDAGNHDTHVQEKSLTLEYAKLLADKLTEAQYSIRMTRTGDEFVSLKERTAMTDHQQEALFISLHANYAKSSKAHGLELFIPSEESTRQLRSAEFAKAVRTSLSKSDIEIRGTKEASFWVLNRSECPAVLIELGFLSSETDMQNMASEAYKERITDALVNSIDLYAQ